MTLSFSVPCGRPLTLWTSSKHNNQGLYTAREKKKWYSAMTFFFLSLRFSHGKSPSLPAGTSNQIKTRGPDSLSAQKTDWRREFIATLSLPLLLVILDRNQIEEERAACADQTRYNNKKKPANVKHPNPSIIWAMEGVWCVYAVVCMDGPPVSLMGNRWCLIIGLDRLRCSHS